MPPKPYRPSDVLPPRAIQEYLPPTPKKPRAYWWMVSCGTACACAMGFLGWVILKVQMASATGSEPAEREVLVIKKQPSRDSQELAAKMRQISSAQPRSQGSFTSGSAPRRTKGEEVSRSRPSDNNSDTEWMDARHSATN